MRKCELCQSTLYIEEHHEIPRAYGGYDSPLHILCNTCHTFLHDTATAILGSQRKHLVDVLVTQWAKEQLNRLDALQRSRAVKEAKRLVLAIVAAALRSKEHSSELYDNPQEISIVVPRWLRSSIKRAARDQGISMQQFIVDTLEKAVASKGFVKPKIQSNIKEIL